MESVKQQVTDELYKKLADAEIERLRMIKEIWRIDTIINNIHEKLKKYGIAERKQIHEERLRKIARMGACYGDSSYHCLNANELRSKS